MSTQALRVTLPAGALYVSGTVNSVAVTWTNTEGNAWEAVAERSADDVYRVELTVINGAGAASQVSLTLYYGVLNLITDRTRADVDRASYLGGLWGPEGFTGTAGELAEWLTPLKGAYNAEDLNRVGSAVAYLAGRLEGYGYAVAVSPKTDWTVGDEPTLAQLTAYLADVEALRGAIAVPGDTPRTPEDMAGLTYSEANDIEKILKDLDLLLTNMAAAWYYSGEIYAGEV